jgi:hypothetical protein
VQKSIHLLWRPLAKPWRSDYGAYLYNRETCWLYSCELYLSCCVSLLLYYTRNSALIHH